MRKMTFLFALLFAAQMLWAAPEGMPIPSGKLPATAQQFIKTFFPSATVLSCTQDKDALTTDYEVVLSDGITLEFDASGDWTEVKSVKGVPSGVVNAPIRRYVEQNHAGMPIVGIERERKGYEVTFSNGMELHFDANGKIVVRDH